VSTIDDFVFSYSISGFKPSSSFLLSMFADSTFLSPLSILPEQFFSDNTLQYLIIGKHEKRGDSFQYFNRSFEEGWCQMLHLISDIDLAPTTSCSALIKFPLHIKINNSLHDTLAFQALIL
jgi:hypothetical protein